MSKVRLKRLNADFDKLKGYARMHPRVKLLQSEGEPPEKYQLEYHIRSVRMVDEELQSVKNHMVEIVLPRNYPRTPPQCRMLSPVFHPNIAPHAICVGDHWSPGEPLVSIVIRIGELLAYQVYNVKSPLNGDAARWVEQNEERLPLDSVSMLVEENGQPTETPPHASSKPSPVVRPQKPLAASTNHDGPKSSSEVAATIACPKCQKQYRFRKEMLGQKLRCSNCESVFSLPRPD